MTTFVVSHNLQINSEFTPPFSGEALASGLVSSSTILKSAVALNHSHWLVRIDSELSPKNMAIELVKAWKIFRLDQGHSVDHSWIALGGRKDSAAMTSSAPLQQGYWGVDVVECTNSDAFLESINWDALKAGRLEDAVFEYRG
jgi:hypothetical protein